MIGFCHYTPYVFGVTSILGNMEGSGEEVWKQRITLAYNIQLKIPVYCFTR